MITSKRKVNAFIVSDATGVTAEMVISAALVQFSQIEPVFNRFSHIATRQQIEKIMQKAEENEAIVIYSFASQELRKWLAKAKEKRNVHTIDLLGPLLGLMGRLWNMQPDFRPGIFKGIGEASRRLADSIDFTIKHDDGKRVGTWDKADLIILGISRTSKTPTSLYLSCNYNLKVANFPIVAGEPLPEKIFAMETPVVGFTISPNKAVVLRQRRLKYAGPSDYTDLKSIQQELRYSHKLLRPITGLQMIDVTHSSIEEIANEIIVGMEKWSFSRD